MNDEQRRARSIWRLPKVLAVTGIRKSNLYNKLDAASKYFDPTFPKQVSLSHPVKPGARTAVGWYSDEVIAWVASRRWNAAIPVTESYGEPVGEPRCGVGSTPAPNVDWTKMAPPTSSADWIAHYGVPPLREAQLRLLQTPEDFATAMAAVPWGST
jgi:predicted DNA-binding transcriptional regulator AlpA